MNKKSIMTGLAAVVGAALFIPSYLEAESDKPAVETRQAEKKPIDLRQDGIKKVTKRFISEYLIEGNKSQESLRDAIKSNGLEKVIEVYSKTGFDYLSLARERVDTPSRYTPEQLDKKYKEISDNFINQIKEIMKKTPIDYTKKEIRDNYASWIRHKTEFCTRLLSSDVSTDSYCDLVKKTFSAEEYRDCLRREIEIIKKLYDSLNNSRVGVVGLFASDEIKKDGEFQIRFIIEKSWEYYPEAKPKEKD